MDRKTNIENFLLKKALLLEKKAFPSKASEIEKKLEFIKLESGKIDDLPKSLKNYRSSPILIKRALTEKSSYAFKVNMILEEANEPLSARDILIKIYVLFEALNAVEDRKHIRLVSTVLNQGCIKRKYKKIVVNNVLLYSLN